MNEDASLQFQKLRSQMALASELGEAAVKVYARSMILQTTAADSFARRANIIPLEDSKSQNTKMTAA
jgi:hypothetical protein